MQYLTKPDPRHRHNDAEDGPRAECDSCLAHFRYRCPGYAADPTIQHLTDCADCGPRRLDAMTTDEYYASERDPSRDEEPEPVQDWPDQLAHALTFAASLGHSCGLTDPYPRGSVAPFAAILDAVAVAYPAIIDTPAYRRAYSRATEA